MSLKFVNSSHCCYGERCGHGPLMRFIILWNSRFKKATYSKWHSLFTIQNYKARWFKIYVRCIVHLVDPAVILPPPPPFVEFYLLYLHLNVSWNHHPFLFYLKNKTHWKQEFLFKIFWIPTLGTCGYPPPPTYDLPTLMDSFSQLEYFEPDT